MCGIIGICGKKISQTLFEEARDTLAKRGPDDRGFFEDKNNKVMLGHRRLSIIDLSKAGHQPMNSLDGRFTIIFNGEIYNYLEIRQELQGVYDFKTKTDTEVLIAAYSLWKEGCLEKLNGMFAFAIWDSVEKKLFCARDRFGEKPFFWAHSQHSFMFASEIKALLALGVDRKPNIKIIGDYLGFGMYDHSDETFFENIYKLSAGSYLVFDGKRVVIKKYWDITSSQGMHANFTKDQIKEKLNFLIEDSIRLRFRSDVPVGVNLSSGLDSNTLYYYSYLMRRTYPDAFSMSVKSREYNECEVLEQILNSEQKKKWHVSTLNPTEVFTEAYAMNMIQDQPYGGIPTIAYGKLNAQAQKNNVTVLLEGQGVDEILAGYKYYELEHNKDHGLNTATSSTLLGQDMTRLTYSDILDKSFVKKMKAEEGGLFDKNSFGSHLLNAQYRDLFYTKLPRVLRFNDHVSMAYSRELRLPFLDHRIVELCFWLPSEYKINKGVHKVILRELLNDYLPSVVHATPKKAFGAIQTEWFRTYFKKEIERIILSESFASRGLWNVSVLKDRLIDFFDGKGENSFFIWQCINLELWFRAFID